MEVMEAGSVFWRIGIPVRRACARDSESDANYQICAVGKERRK